MILTTQLLTTTLGGMPGSHKSELHIDRQQWWRGRGSGNSRLQLLSSEVNRFNEGIKDEHKVNPVQRCCLGFYALACGLPEQKIIDVGWFGSNNILVTPDDDNTYAKLTTESLWLNERHREFNELTVGGELAGINDDRMLMQHEREEKIARLFLERGGVRVTFYN